MSETANTITDEIFNQIMEIRNSGRVNMCETAAVQREAFNREFYDLTLFIEEHRKDYFMFILNGKREQ